MRQGGHDGDERRLAGFLVENLKNIRHWVATGLRPGPAGQHFSHGVHAGHPGVRVRGDHRIANGIEGDGQVLLAVPEGGIGRPQLGTHRLLGFQQMAGVNMHQGVEPLLRLLVYKIGEEQRRQQHQQTGGNDEGQQPRHVRLEFSINLRQGILFDLGEGPQLGTNGIHQPLTLASADEAGHTGHVLPTAQGDDLPHFRPFGLDQGPEGLQPLSGRAALGGLFQGFQFAENPLSHRQVRSQEGLVARQRIPALSGLRVRDRGEQAFRAKEYLDGVLACPG